jgi:outer membrane protein assembly factor BamB
MSAKQQIRDSNLEIRNKSEYRNPKPGIAPWFVYGFGFRVSDLFRISRFGFRIFCLLLLVTASLRADWPQFRGPSGTGTAGDVKLPVAWSATENLRWKADLPGRGLSNPVVAGGRVFVTASSGAQQDRLHVLCFDAKTGKRLWQRQFRATASTQCHDKTNMAAPTPATDGRHVYALFATQDLFCLDKDGDLVWCRALRLDYPTASNNIGMAASPILHKDTLFVALENAGESYGLAIDKQTGQNRWKAERARGINWTTPLVIAHNGRSEVVFQSGADVSGYDVTTGRKNWSFTEKKAATIPSLVFGDGTLLVPGGRFLALRPQADATPALVWESNKLPAGQASPAVHEGRVYALSQRGVLNCAEVATGKPLWDLRLEGDYCGSPLIADGKLFAVNEEGTTTVVALGAKPAILGTNPLADKMLASPVAASGAIFLRSDRRLYCIGAMKE